MLFNSFTHSLIHSLNIGKHTIIHLSFVKGITHSCIGYLELTILEANIDIIIIPPTNQSNNLLTSTSHLSLTLTPIIIIIPFSCCITLPSHRKRFSTQHNRTTDHWNSLHDTLSHTITQQYYPGGVGWGGLVLTYPSTICFAAISSHDNTNINVFWVHPSYLHASTSTTRQNHHHQ